MSEHVRRSPKRQEHDHPRACSVQERGASGASRVRTGPGHASRPYGGPSRKGTARTRHGVGRIVVAVLVFCIGLGVSVYPYIAQHVNNETATRLSATFNADAQGQGGVPATGSAGSSAAYTPIPQDMYGTISIPRLSLDLPIFVGSTNANLAKGIAHLEGTSLPTGGENTHAVLAGHNGAVTNEWFTHIDRLAPGDLFIIRTADDVLTYKVVSTRIIAPSDTSALLIQRGKDLVTLLTCTDTGQERLIVTGERVPSS